MSKKHPDLWEIHPRKRLVALVRADHLDMATLAELAGLDPSCDLAGTDLAGTDLTGIALPGAELSDADLAGACLRHANLAGARLDRAHIHAGNLGDADLRKASLRDANLRDADLSNARIEGADFTGADLTGANLTGIDLGLLNRTAQFGLIDGKGGGRGGRGDTATTEELAVLPLRFPIERLAETSLGLLWRIAAMGREGDEEWLDDVVHMAESDTIRRELTAERARLARSRTTGYDRDVRLGLLNRDLALIEWWLARHREAKTYAEDAIRCAERANHKGLLLEGKLVAIGLAVAGAHRPSAERLLTSVYRDIRDWTVEARARMMAAELAIQNGQYMQARELLRDTEHEEKTDSDTRRLEISALRALLRALCDVRTEREPDMITLVHAIDRRSALREPFRSFLSAARGPARRQVALARIKHPEPGSG